MRLFLSLSFFCFFGSVVLTSKIRGVIIFPLLILMTLDLAKLTLLPRQLLGVWVYCRSSLYWFFNMKTFQHSSLSWAIDLYLLHRLIASKTILIQVLSDRKEPWGCSDFDRNSFSNQYIAILLLFDLIFHLGLDKWPESFLKVMNKVSFFGYPVSIKLYKDKLQMVQVCCPILYVF